MISGWLYNSKSGCENRLRKQILTEIRYINDFMDPSCYRVKFKDLEYASVEEINRDADDANTEVIIVGHGQRMPVLGFARNDGSTISLSELKVDKNSLFGCYVSPWIRGQDKDTYSKMYEGILARLVSLTPKLANCCKKKDIVIYEGEFQRKKMDDDLLRQSGNSGVDWRWSKISDEDAKERENVRDGDLQTWLLETGWTFGE